MGIRGKTPVFNARLVYHAFVQAEARAALDQSQAANYGVFANFVVIGDLFLLTIVLFLFENTHLQVVLLLLPLWCAMSCKQWQPLSE